MDRQELIGQRQGGKSRDEEGGDAKGLTIEAHI